MILSQIRYPYWKEMDKIISEYQYFERGLNKILKHTEAGLTACESGNKLTKVVVDIETTHNNCFNDCPTFLMKNIEIPSQKKCGEKYY